MDPMVKQKTVQIKHTRIICVRDGLTVGICHIHKFSDLEEKLTPTITQFNTLL